jgi:A/G-specific adenine glycosylase
LKRLSPDLLKWFRHSGRHDLPWQQDKNPYRVWVSEIMLQQTQVKTVIPYYERFMQRFPDVDTLAAAPVDEVLHLWSGLGYYARGRNLHKAARLIMSDFGGVFPDDIDKLMSLPGIGRSTAGAILALGLQQVHPILDGNVKRVLTRYHGINGWPGDKLVEDKLWVIAAQETPRRNIADYTQAIMDLGATVCTRNKPRCDFCPLSVHCFARTHNQQSELPTRKKSKQLPVRQTVLVIIENKRGEVLLQRRPPAGIWGGLWSLPECPSNEALPAWLNKRFGSKVTTLTALQPLRHTFSHFHLDIHPYRAKLRANDVAVRDEDTCWYRPDSQTRLGMAAPITKLLSTLTEHTAGADE